MRRRPFSLIGHLARAAQQLGIGRRLLSCRDVCCIWRTGKTGQCVVSQALARGWTVRAIVRDPAKLAVVDERLAIAQGDIGDSASIRAALVGQWDAVVSALGIFSKASSTALSDGTRRIVAEMHGAGMKRIVVISSLGAGDSNGQGTFMVRMIQRYVLRETLIDKTRQERDPAQQRSGVDLSAAAAAHGRRAPARRSRDLVGCCTHRWQADLESLSGHAGEVCSQCRRESLVDS
ncbi:MAG: NAD(P)H-binding protein [Nitrospiraceae bacterium]|nr:NAD(P)H-binding protein [Nitrospiraceae bacterium]